MLDHYIIELELPPIQVYKVLDWIGVKILEVSLSIFHFVTMEPVLVDA